MTVVNKHIMTATHVGIITEEQSILTAGLFLWL